MNDRLAAYARSMNLMVVIETAPLMVADNAAPAFLDWSSNRQQIAVTAVKDKSQALVRDAEEACGAGDAAA